jgi:hypothetical protein
MTMKNENKTDNEQKLKLTDVKRTHSDEELELILNKKCIDASAMSFDSEYEIISFTNLMNNELNTYPECVTSPDKQLHKTYEDMESLKTIPTGRTIVVPPGNAYLREDNEDDDILFFYQSKSNDTYTVRKSTFAELHLPLPTIFDIKYYDTTNDLLEVEHMEIGVPETSPVDRYIYYTQKDVIVKFKHKDYIINFFKNQKEQNETVSPFIDTDTYTDSIEDEYTSLTDQAVYELSKIVLDEDDADCLPNTRKMALNVIRKINPGIPKEIADYNTKVLNRKNDKKPSELFPGDAEKEKQLSEVERLLGMNIHELFDTIKYKKEKPVSALPELDIDKMMHDIKNSVTIENDTWAIFTCKSMDMNKPYEMSGAPADSESIEFDVYLGKLTVTTQGTYAYIYNMKTREQILCLKEADYFNEIKRLFGIDMNSDTVPNIVVNANGYKVATSHTGKSYIAAETNEANNNTHEVHKDDADNSRTRTTDIHVKDTMNKPVEEEDDFADICLSDKAAKKTDVVNEIHITCNESINIGNTDSPEPDETSRVNALKEKLNSFYNETGSNSNEHEELMNASTNTSTDENEVLYGGYDSEVSYAKAHDELMRKRAKEIPEEYINHCNIKQEDVKTDSGADVFARYANMKFNVTPVPPEAEQNVHVCEDINEPTEDVTETAVEETATETVEEVTNENTQQITTDTAAETESDAAENDTENIVETAATETRSDNQVTDIPDASGNSPDSHINEFMNKPIGLVEETDTEDGNDVCSREESTTNNYKETKIDTEESNEPVDIKPNENEHGPGDNLNNASTNLDTKTDDSPNTSGEQLENDKHTSSSTDNKSDVDTFPVAHTGNVPGQVDITVLDDEEYVKQELERDMSRINKMYNQRLINFNSMNIDVNSIVPKDENEKIVLDIIKFRKERSYHPTYPDTYKDYSDFFFNDDFYDNLNDNLIDKIIHADLDAMDTAAFNEFITGLSDKEKWIVRTAKLCYLYTGIKLFNDDKSINEAAKIHTSDITNDTDNMFDEEGFLILVDYNMELARKHIIGGAKFLDKEECDMWIEEEKRIREENEASAG